MDELYSRGGGQHEGRLDTEDPGHLHAQGGPDALAACEHGVPHGPFEPLQPGLLREPEPVQILLEESPVRLPAHLATVHAGLTGHAPPRRAPAVPHPSTLPPRKPARPRRRTPWRARRPR